MRAVNLDELLQLADEGARRAGRLLIERFGGPARGVDTKSSPTDLVSDADRDSEQLLLDLIASKRPDDGVLGEEGGGRAGTTGVGWILDPLDGTVNYLYGIPVWCVSVGVHYQDQTLLGVIHDPNRDETFSAIRGRGAWLDGRRIRVSSQSELSQALVATGFSYEADIRGAQAEVAARLLSQVRDIRRSGSAALDFCSVACGRVDVFYESWLAPWDRAAGELIAHEAGATISDLPPPRGNAIGVVAANPALHAAVDELVRV
jgi:myo-inositol-1(or 4)-monophosphatase